MAKSHIILNVEKNKIVTFDILFLGAQNIPLFVASLGATVVMASSLLSGAERVEQGH